MDQPSPDTPALPPPPETGLWATVRASLSGEEFDYTAGSLNRGIVLLAIPMILEMLMESTFAVVDVYFVARLGSAAMATVGLTESMITILYAVAIGLSMSVTATVSRRIGEKDRPGAAQAAAQAIYLGVALSTIIAVVGVVWGGHLLRLMGASPEVLAGGVPYTRVMFGTNAVIFLLFLNNAIFRGAGDPALAMRTLWIANGINCVLDPCLIFGWGPFPEMGLTGAAVATTIGRGVGVAYQFWNLRSRPGPGHHGRIHLDRTAWRPDLGAMGRLVRISLGGIGQFLIATASWVALVRIVAPFGDVAVAGYTVGIRILIFTFLPSWGLSNAAATLVGQNLGAGRPERAEAAVYRTGLWNMAFLVTVGAIMLLMPRQLVGLFTDDPEVVAIGADCLRIIAYGYPFYAWGMVMIQAFNGAGDTGTPTWINLIAFWMLEIPLAWFFARSLEWGPNGVFTAVPLAESSMALLALLVFRRGRWKTRTV